MNKITEKCKKCANYVGYTEVNKNLEMQSIYTCSLNTECKFEAK